MGKKVGKKSKKVGEKPSPSSTQLKSKICPFGCGQTIVGEDLRKALGDHCRDIHPEHMQEMSQKAALARKLGKLTQSSPSPSPSPSPNNPPSAEVGKLDKPPIPVKTESVSQ